MQDLKIFEIPLTKEPQTFEVQLKDKYYRFKLLYNDLFDCYTFDLYSINGDPLLLNHALVSGTNMLDMYNYLEFKGVLITYADGEPNLTPNLKNLGDVVKLYFITF